MDSMEFLVLIFCVIPALVTSITISPNGNSPEIKMIGGMMVDVQNGFMPMAMTTRPPQQTEVVSKKSRQMDLNSSSLTINERYRRLIPYMTFYYANDLAAPTTEPYTKDVVVQKAEIVEAPSVERQPKKIIHSPYRNIPRYQGNRLTQYNIASAFPTKVYKDVQVPVPVRAHTAHYNNYLSEHNVEGQDFRRVVYRPNNIKLPSAPFAQPTRKPYLNFYQNEEPGIRYYVADKEQQQPKYKLVPYEQTPPVKVNQNEDLYDIQQRPVQEQVYVKPRPSRPQYAYDNVFIQPVPRKPPTIVSESYYEKQRPQHQEMAKPIIESGFKPILGATVTSEAPVYTSTIAEPVHHYDGGKHHVQIIETPIEEQTYQDVPTPVNHRPNYYPYAVDPLVYQPPATNKLSLGDLLNSLQINKSIPKPITKENVGTSIRTLLQVLDYLKASPQNNDLEPVVMSTPKPFIAPKLIVTPDPPKQVVIPAPPVAEVEFQREPYLAPINPPSQHIDDYTPGSTSQRFPLQQENDDEGGTPGRPGVDYPVLTTIPSTSFDCKTQRYKGFFADPETRCQVWHYCDLNGGQASFLCPNGTIFSQAGLTCDWWFNVRCASTTQLYVLNESLYKYILPHSPKFPEDYSGPLVDKYLTLKFKEMEEQFKKNKNKQSAAEKVDSDEEETPEDSTKDQEPNEADEDAIEMTSVSESSVVVGSPGTSGNVERLQD